MARNAGSPRCSSKACQAFDHAATISTEAAASAPSCQLVPNRSQPGGDLNDSLIRSPLIGPRSRPRPYDDLGRALCAGSLAMMRFVSKAI
jgi:hypothetical protein